MKIEIFGTGCSKCNELEKRVMGALGELGLRADVSHIRNPDDMASRGVWVTPAVAVDGKIVIEGRLPSHDEIRGMLSGRKG